MPGSIKARLNLFEVVFLNVLLILVALFAQLPVGFYCVSAAANLLLMLPMKEFYWLPGTRAGVTSGRFLLAIVASAWITAAAIRILIPY
jgi:hypothetical protein